MAERPSAGGPEHTHTQGKGSTLLLIELHFFSFPFFKLASDVYRSSEDVFHI